MFVFVLIGWVIFLARPVSLAAFSYFRAMGPILSSGEPPSLPFLPYYFQDQQPVLSRTGGRSDVPAAAENARRAERASGCLCERNCFRYASGNDGNLSVAVHLQSIHLFPFLTV